MKHGHTFFCIVSVRQYLSRLAEEEVMDDRTAAFSWDKVDSQALSL